MPTTQQTTVIELPHTLTNDEKLELQNKIMKSLDTKQDLAAELISAQGRFKRDKADIEKRENEVEADINKVRGEIKVGVEMRKYKCNILRDRDTRIVQYVVIDGPLAGEVVKTTDFTQADWDAILEDSEPELPFDDVIDDEPQDLRSKADLTAEGPVQPDMENGKVIGGPNTDAYNMLHKDSPYQHLSEPADFTPVVPMYQQEGTEPIDAPDVDTEEKGFLRRGSFVPNDEQAEDDQSDDSDGGDDADEDSDGNGDGDGDEPQTPAPTPPKRKAARRKDVTPE